MLYKCALGDSVIVMDDNEQLGKTSAVNGDRDETVTRGSVLAKLQMIDIRRGVGKRTVKSCGIDSTCRRVGKLYSN